jgi:hypothetical protein
MFARVCESQLPYMDTNASVLSHFMAMTLFAVQIKPKIFFIMPPNLISCSTSSIHQHMYSAWSLKADSRIPCCSHVVPLPCRSAKGLDCDFPIWFTQCRRVWYTHTMPFPCLATNMPFTAGLWQGDGMRTAWERHVGDLPAFSVFLLPHGVPESLLSEANHLRCRWPVWNKATFVIDMEKLIILVQGHRCLYNLQHNN